MKHQKVITFLLSVVVFVVAFLLCQPVFMVKANYCEMEIISKQNDDGVNNYERYEPIFIQDLNLLKMNYQNTYYSTAITELSEKPNIVLIKCVNLPIGEYVWLVNETDEWRTVIWNEKIYYISKFLRASLPVSQPEEVEKEPVLDSEQVADNVLEEEKPNYTIENTDKEKYVNTSILNVRKGPGTSYKKIGSFGLNEKVHVIGITNNGWSQIEYKDGYAFVHSSYLSNSKVETENKPNGNSLSNYPDAYGILKIPNVGIDVVLYSSTVTNNSQHIVDKKNSAAYLFAQDVYGFNLIADHAHQGFSAIQYANVNQTIAYIERVTGSEEYVCTAKFTGKNNGRELVDSNGTPVSEINNGELVMYTCYPSHPDVMITFWSPR